MRRVAIVTALAALLTMVAAPAVAQVYPPAAATCAADDGTPAAGSAVTLVCSGWLPNSTVSFALFSQHTDLGTAQVGADGTLRAAVTIPADTAPGEHTLRISGTNANGQPQVVNLVFDVAAAGTGVTPATGLPATGSEPLPAALAALGLFVAGGAALVTARRRNALQGA